VIVGIIRRKPVLTYASIIFGDMLASVNSVNETWHGGRPQPRPHCVRRGPSSPRKKWAHSLPPIFVPCLLWPNSRMYQNATWYGLKR